MLGLILYFSLMKAREGILSILSSLSGYIRLLSCSLIDLSLIIIIIIAGHKT